MDICGWSEFYRLVITEKQAIINRFLEYSPSLDRFLITDGGCFS